MAVAAALQLLVVPTGLEVREDLRVELGPVADASEQASDVDEVEGILRIGPFRGGVVDFEAEVRGDEGGLDGREIGADDSGRRILVGEVDGPDTGAGGDVEDELGVGLNGRQKEAVVEEH